MNVIAIHKTTGDIAYLVDTLSDNYKCRDAGIIHSRITPRTILIDLL